MKYDIDQMIDLLDPWDLSVSIGGEEYSIRPIAVGEISRLDNRSLESLFAGEKKPDFALFSPDTITAIAASITDYIKERAEKNFLSLVAQAPSARGTKRANH